MNGAFQRGGSVRPIPGPRMETRSRPSTLFPLSSLLIALVCLLLAGSSGARADERTPITPQHLDDPAFLLQASTAPQDATLPSTGAPRARETDPIGNPTEDLAKAGDPDGGDDVLAVTAEEFRRPSLACAANGDLYLAVSERDPAQGDLDIHVYRSQDGGKTWASWGQIGDGLILTNHTNPVVVVPPGPNEACYVAYTYYSSGSPTQVRLARSSVGGASAVFTSVAAFSDASVDFDQPDLVTDAVDHESYWIYLVAQADDGNGGDIWFTRSTDLGASCEPAYAIASLVSSDRRYEYPRIDYGLGARIHVSWQFELDGADQAARYRNADDYANGGISAWNSYVYLTTTSNGIHERTPVVRASDVSAEVVLHYRRLNTSNVIQWSRLEISSDQGTTWGVEPSQDFEPAFQADVLEIPNGGGWAWITDDENEAQVKWCPLGSSFWTAPHDLMDRDYYDGRSWARLAACASSAHAGEVALAWVDVGPDPDQIWFDATWRDDPGYPNMEAGMPVPIPAAPRNDPAVVDVDGDGDLEIVYGDEAGRVQVLQHDGSPLPGWPVLVGTMEDDAPVAIGDLHGDGGLEIVAATTSGWVHAFTASGEVLPGWPVDLGTGEDAFVSIGAVQPPYVRYVVVCSGFHLWLLNYAGVVQSGFPWTFSGAFQAPAAVGDIDGDGYGEIVTAKNDWLHVNDPRSATPQAYRKLTGETFPAAPSLGNVDHTGDFEIAVPTNSGSVYLLNSDLSDRSGWPATDPSGYPASAVALGQTVASLDLDVAFAHQDYRVHNYYGEGGEVPGWPYSTGTGWWIYGGPIIDRTDALASDIVIGARDGFGHDWDGLGGPNMEWPKDLGGQCEVTPASGDIDDDGRLELVFLTRTVLAVVDVGEYEAATVSEHQKWPMAMHDPQRTSCTGCSENLATPAPVVTQTSFRPPAPNPASASTTFRFSLRDRSRVRLNVYDARGRLTRRLVDESQGAGWQRVAWDGRDDDGHPVANGAYFARLAVDGPSGEEVFTRRVVLLR